MAVNTHPLAWRRLAGLLCVAIVASSCAVPGHLYRVSPPVMGVLHQTSAGNDSAELVLTVMHRENPTIFEVQRATITPEGRFYFEPVALDIAGREYSKFYRVFLRHRRDQQDQVLWRAEFSRTDLAGRIQLDCSLERRPRVSQPCLVREPLAHPWLVKEGARSFRRLCAGCHGETGAGGTVGTTTAPDLSRIASRRGGHFDRMTIAQRLEGSEMPTEHGLSTMPAWGERLSAEYWRYSNADQLVGATIDPIVIYLESLQHDE